MPWNPEQYLKFKEQRYQPFVDLLSLIKSGNDLRVVDLGCGNGELTRRLADALPGCQVLGIDESEEMLAGAAQYAGPDVRFERGRIEDLQGEFDLIFSHAAIQWVPHHEELIPRLYDRLAPGGQLAVQVPANFAHPTHRLIEEVAEEEPFRQGFNGYRKDFPVLSISEYAELLNRIGATDLTVMAKIYSHYLENSDGLAEWMAGTALVPYLENLPPELHAGFMDRYRQRLREVFPGSPVFFGFERILFAANKPE
jgi:trans-aconitate 2-methyltransferase